VDDEGSSREVLKALLKKFCPTIQITGEACNVDEAYKFITELKPEVVFLDVQMPGGNGFSLLKRFIEIPFQVIFVTSYDKYALDAIRCSALYYLMKPIEVPFLLDAVDKLNSRIENRNTQKSQILNLIHNESTPGIEKKIAVHSTDTVVFLPVNEIIYLEGMDEYTSIQTLQGNKFTSSKNLGKFEEMLDSFPQFLRISKSHIVNINYVDHYTKGEPCFITISAKYTFEISRRRKREFLDRIKN